MLKEYRYYIFSTLAVLTQSYLLLSNTMPQKLHMMLTINALFICFYILVLKNIFIKVSIIDDGDVGINLIKIKILDSYYVFFNTQSNTPKFVCKTNREIKEFHYNKIRCGRPHLALYYSNGVRISYKYENDKWKKQLTNN